MPTPPQLVEAISSATGVPLPTVIDIDRRLVKAKLRSKGGRGRNAARMTSLDAARLLTAILASPQANTAADAVARYSLTAPDRTRSSGWLFAEAGLDDLAALPARHSFVEALAALLPSAGIGPLATMSPSIEVYAFTQTVRGRIRISGLPDHHTVSVEYAAASDLKTPRRSRNAEPPGDLEQSRRITERTLMPIARLLTEGKQR